MEIIELLSNHLGSPHYGDEEQSKSVRFKYQEVIGIIEWLQIYTAVISHKEPNHVMGYQNLIIQSLLETSGWLLGYL